MGGGGTKDFTIYIHGNTNPLDQQIEKLSKRAIKLKMDVDTKSLNSVLQKMDHMIADVEKYFKQDFDILKETVDEYNGLYIEENKITFEIEWWEVFKQPILKGAI